jgi:putative transposase
MRRREFISLLGGATRTHLSLDKDCPESRTVHLPAAGKIIAFPELGGLHHRYERRAA